MSKKRICFVAGKSGGHIIPALTCAHHERHSDPAVSISFFATNNPLDKKILTPYQDTFLCTYLSVAQLPKGFSVRTWLSWCAVLCSFGCNFVRVFLAFLCHRPYKVVSTGGLVSVPVCCAAWVLRIPVHVYELNVVPGKAVKLLARFASCVYVCFSTTKQYFSEKISKKVTKVAYPVYCGLSTYQLPVAKQSRIDLKIAPGKKVLFVMGGSQGSAFLNKVIQEFICFCSEEQKNNLVLIHLAGAKNEKHVRSMYATLDIDARVYGYCDRVDVFQTVADCMILRAGAGALFEGVFFKKPSVIVPLEIGRDMHQVHNAHACRDEHPELFSVWRQGAIEKQKHEFFGDIAQKLF